MGSVGNQNPWTTPYDNYQDCSPGICTIYCPQFCYFIFPPPPADDTPDDTPFSPLFIAVLAVLAAALLLVAYYTLATRYCRRRTAIHESEDNRTELVSDQWRIASAGLDDALISKIRVCKYRKGDSLIEGTECAVCLTEFRENDSLRLLPKCSHAFHLPCIDTWLKSHSNCPMCRGDVFPVPPPDDPSEIQAQASDEVVLTVEDHREEDDEDFKQFRRSISLGTFPISINGELQKDECGRGIGGSSVKRSLSTGGLMMEKGRILHS